MTSILTFYGISIFMAILFIIVLIILVVYYVLTNNMSTSFKNAWNFEGECADNNPKCKMIANDALGTLDVEIDLTKYQKKNSIILMDLLERLTIAAENKTSYISVPPIRTELLATYFTVPYFIALWRQVTSNNKVCLIYTFRGTSTNQEVRIDQQVSQIEFLDSKTKVHSGFNYYYLQFRDTLLKSLKDNYFDYIFISGHSLGAAVATLFSFDIIYNKQVTKENQITNIFGCPNVGNPEFSDLIESLGIQFWSIKNNADLVITVPWPVMINTSDPSGQLWYYKSSGTPIEFYRNWNSIKDSHLLPVYKYSIEFLD